MVNDAGTFITGIHNELAGVAGVEVETADIKSAVLTIKNQ